MTPSSQELEPPGNPGRFSFRIRIRCLRPPNFTEQVFPHVRVLTTFVGEPPISAITKQKKRDSRKSLCLVEPYSFAAQSYQWVYSGRTAGGNVASQEGRK